MASARNILLVSAIFTLLISSLCFSASSVKVTLYPDSNSYVLRTYTFSNAGLFTLNPEEIKGVSPSAISAFGNNAEMYFISRYELTKSKQEKKTLADMLNESVNKKVTLKSSAGDYSGTLQWYDDQYIGILDAKGLHIIPLLAVTDLSLPNTSAYKDVEYNEYALSVLGSSKANGALTFGYVKRDLTWGVNYDLVVSNGQGKLTQYTTISNNGDEKYENADLTLSMLNPNFVGYSIPYSRYDYMVKTSVVGMYESAPSQAQPVFTASSKGGIWSYRPDTPITLEPRSSHKVILFTDTATYTKKYVWNAGRGTTVYRVYELNNTRKEVLPSGTVRVFDTGEFVGEDTIDMLASKSSKELYVADVPQIEVSKQVISDDISGTAITKFVHTVKVRLDLKNQGGTRTEVEVREDLSGYSDFKYLSFSVQPYKVDGGKAYWKIPLNASGQQSIEYSYTYSSTY